MRQTPKFVGLIGIALPLLLASLTQFSLAAQTQEKGSWWPHPIWGAGDEAGGSNWITPEKVLGAVRLVETGKTYELGQVYERGMPLYGQRTYSILIPEPGPAGGNNQLVANDEFICAEMGQVGTQFDGLGHIGKYLRMADGSGKSVFYNGFTQEDDMRGPYGLRKLGIEKVKPFVTRGVLIDIAGYKGVSRLPHSYEVTVADVKAALARQQIQENGIEPGDALLFRYGWSKLWRDPERYNLNPPGIGLDVAAWVIEKKASMVGSDSWPTEVLPNPNPDLQFPVHQELLTKNGIFNLENMVFEELVRDGVYEFLFIHTPIRFKGATGSPARPIAIR